MAKSKMVLILVGIVGLLSALLTGATAFADETAVPSTNIKVISVTVDADDVNVGDLVFVDVVVANFGELAGEKVVELDTDGAVVDSRTVSVSPNESKTVRFTFVATKAGAMQLGIGGFEQTLEVSAGGAATSAGLQVGPKVKLTANRTVIDRNGDAIIDIFVGNSELNDTLRFEVTIDTPSGLFPYSADGAIGCAANVCGAAFTVPPGAIRNLPIIVKADHVLEGVIILQARYWIEGSGTWNPVSLTTPITVIEPSPNPYSPTPTGDVVDTTTGTIDSRGGEDVSPTAGMSQEDASSVRTSTTSTTFYTESGFLVLWAMLASLVALVLVVKILRPLYDMVSA